MRLAQAFDGEDDDRYPSYDWERYFLDPIAPDFSADPAHTAWIAAYVVSRNGNVRSMCVDAVKEMQAAFPELRHARGWLVCRGGQIVEDPEEGRQWLGRSFGQHHWCVTPAGTIVDPTFSQFGVGAAEVYYLAFDEAHADKLPTGKDPNCGELTYGHRNFCSRSCARDYEAYLAREAQRIQP